MGPTIASTAPESAAETDLVQQYQHVRRASERLAEPLGVEWSMVQADGDCSPTKWHLAHTTWFFDRFVLAGYAARPGRDAIGFDADRLLNSYYQTVGATMAQVDRALLADPSAEAVRTYRALVDSAMMDLLSSADCPGACRDLVVLGLAHEEQHQELIVTDQLAARARHPDGPAWPGIETGAPAADPGPVQWLAVPEGIVEIGAHDDGFAFDNERPRHRELVHGAQLADRLVTNAEFQAFIEAGGYDSSLWWCDAGWQTVREQGWRGPLRWQSDGSQWWQQSAAGLVPLDPHRPVSQLSWFEADAFARWSEARLPTEVEWEAAVAAWPVQAGAHLEDGSFQPQGAGPGPGMRQAFGDCWEWTGSPYRPYPGYLPPDGALGEYNGKFMCDSFVLRGGSCATPQGHARSTYRNFFHPAARWQFSGVRLARDLS